MKAKCNYCSSDVEISIFLRQGDGNLDIMVNCPTCSRSFAGTLKKIVKRRKTLVLVVL